MIFHRFREVGLALLAICLTFNVSTVLGQGEGQKPAPKAHTILVLGDSLSAALGVPEAQGWVALMTKRLSADPRAHWNVINASVSGETTSGGLARLPELLAVYQPDWVLIELGANDGLRGLALPIIRKKLQTLIDMSVAAKANVVLLGIMLPPNYGPAYTTPFAAMYQELAESNKTPLVPFLLRDVASNRERMQSDGLHPNAAGQAIVLENVWSVVAPLWVPL
jgi:acyl-CoA thioesterase-1